MKEFTTEMRDKLLEADKSLIGTPRYTRYLMECNFKGSTSWKFLGWMIPHSTGYIKNVCGKFYIYVESCGLLERYTVSDEVKELLEL